VENGRLVSAFNDYRPNAPAQVYHKGEDVGAPTGSRVFALASGTVIRSRDNDQVSGYHQELTVEYDVSAISAHVEKVYVLYGHMGRGTLLPLGAKVKRGTVLARVGTSYDAMNTAPHAHVQMWVSHRAALNYDNAAAIDPEPIRKAMGEL
jgi:murein DD-endopeptidase MepM/ murein hydrolase activator NlpD